MKVSYLAASLVISSFATTAHASSGAPGPLINSALSPTNCVDVPGFASGDVALQGYSCNSGSNQMWTLTDVALVGGTRYFSVASSSSHKCMAVASGNDFDPVIQQTCNANSVGQQWSLTALSNGYYKLVNRMSGKCLDDGSWPVCDADECRNEYLDDLQQYDCIDDEIQAWHLEPNAMPVPPLGSLAITNHTQVTVLSATLGALNLAVGAGITPGQTATFQANAATYQSILQLGFDATALPTQTGRVVCSWTSTATVSSGATTTLAPPAFNVGQVLSHCGSVIAEYDGGYLDTNLVGHSARIRFWSNNTYTWTFDGVTQPGGTLTAFTPTAQLTTVAFNMGKDHISMIFPYSRFTLTLNGTSVLFQRVGSW